MAAEARANDASSTALRIVLLILLMVGVCALVYYYCVPHAEPNQALQQAGEAEPMAKPPAETAQGSPAVLEDFSGNTRGQAPPEEREPPPLPDAGLLAELKSDAMFERYDRDKDGRLNSTEVRGMLHDNSMDDSDSSVAALIRRFDTDESGDLDKFEFRAVAPQIGYKKSATGWVDPSSYDLRPMYTSTG